MNGLRVYKNSDDGEPAGASNIFYSRRGNGPIYRWRYEKDAAHWRVARVALTDFVMNQVSLAAWKSVPAQLQAQLSEHYVD